MSTNYASANYADFNETPALPQKQPQIAESFDVLEKSLQGLLENCSELEKRLDPVLRHEPEAAGNSQKDAQPTVVAVAQRINENSNRIHVLNNQVNSILRRLEL